MAADFYTILGVPRNASQDEIKKAYRKLAHQHHPDKASGNEAKFKEINEAYQVLSDPKKRSQYDQFGQTFGQAGGPGGFDGFDFSQGGFEDFLRNFTGRTGRGGFDFEDAFDIFGDFFGRSRPRQASDMADRGHDVEVSMDLDFRESIRGGERTIELNKENVCQECSGTGAQKGSKLKDCSVCRGRGEVRENVSSFLGNMVRVYACSVCRGTGKVPEKNCNACKGEGKVKGKDSFTLKIPGGINNGEAIIIKGRGQAGFRGARAGDLYVRFHVRPDKRFTRVGNDIIFGLPIKVTDAILGARIKVPTLDGDKEIEIPAGIQDGEAIRLRGLGVIGSHNGDQIVKIKIDIPRHLSSRAKKLTEELRQELS